MTMDDNLPAEVCRKVEETLGTRLTELAEEAAELSESDGDNESITANLAWTISFYALCNLFEEGKIVLREHS